MRRPEVSDALLAILSDPLLWNPPQLFPQLFSDEEIAAILSEANAADARAVAWCDQLLAGPAEHWPDHFRATPEARTDGVVRELLRRVPALLERRPAHALQVTTIAVAIAEVLGPIPNWADGQVTTRAHASREHAYVLAFLGRHHEALEYVERAERAYAQIDAISFHLERLAEVKEYVLELLNSSGTAVRSTRQAAFTVTY